MPDNNPDDLQQPSKSERKRQMLALQKLGEQLLCYSPAEWDNMALPEPLTEALLLANRIKSREGRRRQLQYIGKLMRSVDAEAISQQLRQRQQGDQQKIRQFHSLERLRDQLINDGPPAVERTLERFPQAQRSRLKQLVRTAIKEQQRQQPAKAARKLFHYLRELAEHEQP
jgi:ribosome-associated protein